MIIYSLFVYTMLLVLVLNKSIDLCKKLNILHSNNVVKIIYFIIFAIFINIKYKDLSVTILAYSILDYPSFTLCIVCILSLIRIFYDIGLVTNWMGKVVVFIFWIILVISALGYIDFTYGNRGYSIFVFAMFCAILYLFDRSYGFIVLLSLVLWTIFGLHYNIYFMGVDLILVLIFPLLEVKKKHKEILHKTVLKPIVR